METIKRAGKIAVTTLMTAALLMLYGPTVAAQEEVQNLVSSSHEVNTPSRVSQINKAIEELNSA